MNLKSKTLVLQDIVSSVDKTINSPSSRNNVTEISLGKKKKKVVCSLVLAVILWVNFA